MKHNRLFFKSFLKSLLPLLLFAGLWSCGGGGGGGEGNATTTPETCAPAPSSAIIENILDYGALGDDDTADTAAIQAAVDAVAGTGGTVWIPAGTYMINAVQSISLRSNMTLRLDPGAVLKAIPNSASSYAVLLVSGVSNVNIVGGGTLEGELSEHDYQSGTTSQWGHCLKICNHANHIVVEDITVKEAMGDGFYISYGDDVTFCNVIADHNRRQGLSIVDADHVVVRNSVFANTIGFLVSGTTMSGMGIDIEPNPTQTVNDVLIIGCTFTNNRYGIGSGVPLANTGSAHTLNIAIDHNIVTGNSSCGIEITNTESHSITNNTVRDNVDIGICLRNDADNNIVSGNIVTGTIPGDTVGYGILLYLTKGNIVTGNIATGNADCDIRDAYPDLSGSNTFSNNTVSKPICH